jgi:hypothetical protein
MPKAVETYRTTKALRDLVRRAAKVVDKRPSEFLRQAAEEKARAVLREAAGENLRKLLARLPPGGQVDPEGQPGEHHGGQVDGEVRDVEVPRLEAAKPVVEGERQVDDWAARVREAVEELAP